MFRKSLQSGEKTLRREHPDILSTKHHLNMALRKQGKPQEADELAIGRVAANQYDEKKSTTSSKTVLASTARSYYDELEDSLRNQKELSTAAGNNDGQITLKNLLSLGGTLMMNGKYAEAENAFRGALLLSPIN